ncbi:cystin-1 [Calypte anna]|uniref:cystin-1 n=1 Tax=Calypte anna TaxID=9244 RepID=UPI0011C3C264|nr:cystin-1 [Calypte anna]
MQAPGSGQEPRPPRTREAAEPGERRRSRERCPPAPPPPAEPRGCGTGAAMGSGSSRRRGAAAAGAAAERRAVPAGGAAAAENWQLLETVLTEGEEAAALPAPGRTAPAAGSIPPPRDCGRCGEAAGEHGGIPPQQAALSTSSPPDPENTANHQCPHTNSKKPSGQTTISYDYAEEELMASIEREYCR